MKNPKNANKSLPGIIFILLLLYNCAPVFAQQAYNQNSVRPVRNADIMYKKRIVRALDLREKQNKPYMAVNNEITRLLLEAVRANKLKPYTNDSLTTVISLDAFNERLIMPSEAAVYDLNNPDDTTTLFITYGPDWRNEALNNKAYYLPKDLYQMELTEYMLFDKNRSRMMYDIQAVTIYIPADHPANLKGIQLPVASFRYKDLVALFKDNPAANYINPQNEQANLNLADAFELRLFSSYIIKVANPEDAYLADKYNDQKKGIMASGWAANDLLEFEHNLWEF